MGSRAAVACFVGLSLAIAACDSGGMEIVVYGPSDRDTPQPHTVKLFIGLGAPTDAAIVTAPNTTGQRFSAKRWDRDPANGDDVAEFGAGPARFVFRPGEGTETFGAVVAVGYAEDGTPTSSAVMFDPQMGNARVRVYSMGLNASSDPIAKRNGYNALKLWGPSSRTTADDSCVFVQNTYPDPTIAEAFIGTPGDRDCDGFADEPAPGSPPECLDDVWFGTRTATRDELSCLTFASPTPAGTDNNTCLLGGPACVDGVGMDASCTASKYCMHGGVCSSSVCGTGAAAWECAKDVSASIQIGTTYPVISCTGFLTMPNGAGTGADICTMPGTFDLRQQLGLPATAKCSSAKIRNRTQRFEDMLVVDAATFKVEIDNACILKITPSGSFPTLTAIPPIGGLLAIDFQASIHGVAYPIQFEFPATTGQCAPVSCHLNGPPAPLLAGCIGAPAPL
ncbi:MAG: hypothetical protein IPQ07_17770 [Myxococcales bacterium]|nr:hypothetical protein [Myxococcales bacterium]